VPQEADLDAALDRARSIRRELADALQDEGWALARSARGPEIAHRATVAIGALYAVELGGARVATGLAEARGILRHLLADLERDPSAAPRPLVEALADALARLEPADVAIR
jgi:hypothetical protein